MKRVRQKNSKDPALAEGNRQLQGQRSQSKLASDSSPCLCGTSKEILFTSEIGRSLTGRVNETPIRKLLADEMSKETDSMRSPNVIARLMGLDGLPPRQPVHGKHKGFSETYQLRTASVACQREIQPYEYLLNRKHSTVQQEFKDVYEVLEATVVDGGTDEKFYNAKEFFDTLDKLDTNKEINLLQHQDPLFIKHLIDLQGSASESGCRHLAVTKPSNSEAFESNAISRKSEKKSLQCESGYPQKRQDGFSTRSSNHHGIQKPCKTSEVHLELKHEKDITPTKIVILKPNIVKLQNATKSVSSPCTSHGNLSDCGKYVEYQGIGTGETGAWIKKKMHDDACFSRPKSGEPREIAKEITRRMKESSCREPICSSSIFWGYNGDESSCDVSESDSGSASEVARPISRKSFRCGNRQKSSLHSAELHVSIEAKKRLSERWKMSQRYKDVGTIGKGSTLGEMLTIPDWEMRSQNLDTVINLDGSDDGCVCNNGTTLGNSPLGISSRDGWKDGGLRKSSGSRSIPASSVGYGGPKASMEREMLEPGCFLIPGEAMNRGRNKSIKGNFNKKKDSLSRNLRSDNKKCHSSLHSCSDDMYCSDAKQSSKSQIEIVLQKKEPSDQKYLMSEAPANNDIGKSLNTDAEEGDGHDYMIMYSQSSNELLSDPSSWLSGNGGSSIQVPNNLNIQELQIEPPKEDSVLQKYTVPEPQSPSSSKEPDHPSPLSVLEVPFTEDVSSGSECFDRVNADLHELRKQLELLKMESAPFADAEMLVSIEKDVGQGLLAVSDEKETCGDQSWESSYIFDVMVDSGLDVTGLDPLVSKWHSPECPLDLRVFGNLEKKYSVDSCLRSERRMLFDLINSWLFKIFQQSMDPNSWMKPAMMSRRLMLQKHGILPELHDLLLVEEKMAKEVVTETTLDSVMLWRNFGDEIEAIGRELEKLLIDDLIADVANVQNPADENCYFGSFIEMN
ncbi:uncharacterized protein LOC127789254 [Diospyros lotus]|uniref:uncharacterized protein LOC127789254 n=1 Tax=Diospyros lotus TaxID=55363 RepID=UPI00224E0C9D|nr:uncharacterized protein LOC127789254 [Diospyros lotus]